MRASEAGGIFTVDKTCIEGVDASLRGGEGELAAQKRMPAKTCVAATFRAPSCGSQREETAAAPHLSTRPRRRESKPAVMKEEASPSRPVDREAHDKN